MFYVQKYLKIAKIFAKPEYIFVIYSELVSWEKGEKDIIFDFLKVTEILSL